MRGVVSATTLVRLSALGLVVLLLPIGAAQPHVPFGREKAPRHDSYEFLPICAEHAAARIVAVERGGRTGVEMLIHGINGTSAEWEWVNSLHNWWDPVPNPFRVFPFYEGRTRVGWGGPAWPWVDNVQPTVDLDGDGYCDLVSYGWDLPYATLPYTVQYDWYLGAYSGLTGDAIWETTGAATVYDDCPRGNPPCKLFRMENYPTGLFVYHDADTDRRPGARFVFKTTNTSYSYDLDFWILIQEHYRLGASDTGELLWNAEHTLLTGGPVVSSRIVGVGEAQGDKEMEIFLEHYRVPDGNGVPLFQVSALRGDLDLGNPVVPINARFFWGPNTCYMPPQRGNDPKQALAEEDNEIFLFPHVRLIDDVDMDSSTDAPEVVCTWLAALTGSATFNGRFRLHIQPMLGETGERLWPRTDVKQQGYGFVTDLNDPPAYRYERWGSVPTGADPDESNQLIGVGTIDVPQNIPRGARFPPKDSRLTVMKSLDSAPIWGTISTPFVQEDFMSYRWALMQYATTLAGRDYTGDGVRELLSAARYRVPSDKEQMLLSTTSHDYLIVDGKRGHVAKGLQTWGPRGMILGCWDQDRNEITAVGGHARRLDVTRWDSPALEINWREPYHLYAAATAQTAGLNLYFLTPRCADVPDGRTMFGWIHGLFSLRRGDEQIGVYAFQNATGDLHWLRPELAYKPPLNATLEAFLDVSEPPPSIKETVGMSLLSVTGGIGAAFGSVALSSRVLRRRDG